MAVARAELPPPDLREAVYGAAEARAEALMAEGRLDEASTLLADFRRVVGGDARLTWVAGLVARARGDLAGAQRHFQEAVDRDPALAAAWYDLGEVLVLRGRLEEAAQALEQAAAGSEDHPNGWAAPMKLAELAARAGDVAGFQRWLREALRRGFALASVLADEAWKAQWAGWLEDPQLGPVLVNLLEVYEPAGAVDALRR